MYGEHIALAKSPIKLLFEYQKRKMYKELHLPYIEWVEKEVATNYTISLEEDEDCPAT